jgi:hypothetical protein
MNTSTQPQDNRDSREIHQDIRATRGDMEQTLERLDERLSPRAIINGMMDWCDSKLSEQSGVVAEKSADILRIVRNNPIPALLTGAGIVWLIFRDKK